MDQARKTELLKSLVETLCVERDADVPRTQDAEELWAYFRALVNTRPPWPTNAGFLESQDELLHGIIAEAGVHGVDEASVSTINPQLRL